MLSGFCKAVLKLDTLGVAGYMAVRVSQWLVSG